MNSPMSDLVSRLRCDLANDALELEAADRIEQLERELADTFDLLTKAVGDISALAIMADRQHKIESYTTAYVAAINEYDARAALSDGGGDV